MITVSAITLEDLTQDEMLLLVRYCQKCFEPVAVEDLVLRVRRSLAHLYRFSGDAEGVFVLAVGDGGLYVETVAGRAVVKYFDAIYDKIKVTALARGARALYSYSARPALNRLYERRKIKAIATLFKEELR